MDQTVPVDEWIMVTDDPELEAPGWRVLYEPRPHLHPCVAAKFPKFLPRLYSESDYTLWVDASFTYEPTMAQMSLDGLHEAPFSLFPHPHRNRIQDELIVARTHQTKYEKQMMEQQVEYYLTLGYPDFGLWATGVLAQSRHMPFGFGEAWLHECTRWSMQDQLSLPYLLWSWGVTPSPIGESQFTSPHVHLGSHK